MSNVVEAASGRQRDTADWRDADRRHHLHPFTDLHAYAERGGRIINRADHVYIYDTDDNEILDGMSGLWCCNLGYGQQRIVDAVAQQLARLPYYNSFFNCSAEPSVALAERLAGVMPAQFRRFFFSSSGSEANDTNIRLVHRYFELLGKPDKKHIISRKNAYHGSTIAAASLGGMPHMHKQMVLLDYVHHVDQPYWFRDGGELSAEEFGIAAARSIERKIDELGEGRVAAFIAEPIQGAGGVIVPPDTYWPEVRRILDERDILFISDEVICGFGRTGNWFGCDTYGTTPDLLTFAKGVTGGYQPLGGVAVADQVADVLTGGGGEFAHGYTYSGHPAPCAAALATLDIMQELELVDRIRAETGPYFRERARSLADHPLVGEVRTKGMLAAFELVRDKAGRAPLAPKNAAALYCRDQAVEGGLMVRAVADAIITAPPFVCSNAELDLLFERLKQALDATEREYPVSSR